MVGNKGGEHQEISGLLKLDIIRDNLTNSLL
jgi:hypothetical protein